MSARSEDRAYGWPTVLYQTVRSEFGEVAEEFDGVHSEHRFAQRDDPIERAHLERAS